MPRVVLLEFNALGSIKSEYNSKVVDLSGRLPVRVTMEVPNELYSLMKADPLCLAKIVEAASERYKKFIKKAVSELKYAEVDFSHISRVDGKNNIGKEFLEKIKELAKDLERDAIKASQEAYRLHAKTQAEYYKYKNFKLGCKAKITVDAVNIVVGGVGVGTAVSTVGVGLIFGLYKLFKSVVSIIREIYTLNSAAQKERDKVEKFLEKASAAYSQDRPKTSTGLKEFAKTFLNSASGIKFLRTIKDAQNTNKIYRAKLLGLDKKSHELSIKLNKALRMSDDAAEELKQQKAGQNHRAIAKINKHLKSIEKSVNKLIIGIIEMQTGLKEGLTWQENAEKKLNVIAGGKPKWCNAMEVGLKFVDVVAYCSIADWGEKTALAALNASRLALTEIDKHEAGKLEVRV